MATDGEGLTRFAFGENWRSFVAQVDDREIWQAQESLRTALGDLDGRSFLDIGSGSGLFSLAARNLGAAVVSFDYDLQSVECTKMLRNRHRPGDTDWRIEQGSALDAEFLVALGQFDVVYSWGVLHHTGKMWTSLELACGRVASGGTLMISLYNDQGYVSRIWRRVKRTYNDVPALRPLLIGVVFARGAVPAVARGQNPLGGRARGMNAWNDLVDWVGGYPFEVATPGDVFMFLRERGLEMEAMHTQPGSGCNEYTAHRL